MVYKNISFHQGEGWGSTEQILFFLFLENMADKSRKSIKIVGMINEMKKVKNQRQVQDEQTEISTIVCLNFLYEDIAITVETNYSSISYEI